MFLTSLLILSCAGYSIRDDRPHGIYHRVKRGETLSVIARAYHVDLQELAEINNIDDPNRMETDAVIFVPDAQQVVDDIMAAASPKPIPVVQPAGKGTGAIPGADTKPDTRKEDKTPPPGKPREAPQAGASARDRQAPPPAPARDLTPRKTAVPPKKEEAPAVSVKPEREISRVEKPVKPKESDGRTDQIQFDKRRFIWPVRGKVVSRFGIQPNRMYFNGIRIAASDGAQVHAADTGQVIFSAHLKDYGETIIIQHEDQYATVYTHLGVRAVQQESRIKRGDPIAFLGKSDHPEGNYLHFEIRHKNKARNPLFFLP